MSMEGRRWTLENIRELQALALEKTPAALIAARLRRTEEEVRAKAQELGLTLPAQ